MMIYLDISNTSYVSHSETSSQQRGRSALKDRCVVVLGEFSEVFGPLALKIIPDDIEKSTREEISNFIVQVMAVDYTGTHAGVPTYSPADTSLLYQQTKSHISALVHYFNLHDVKARGYSRIFTLSFITLSPDCLFPNVNTIKSCFEDISKVCHDENLLMFHSEMLDKKVHFANDVIERRQIQWWLNEMERMYSLPSPAPDSPDNLDKVEGTATDDITLRPFSTYPAGDAGPKLVQSWRSLPSLLDQDPSNKYVKHIVKGKIQCGEGSLRGIAELVPIAYCYLQRSMVQLYKSKGTCGSLKKPCVKETPTLAIGRYSIQFPSPTFTSGVEGIASIDKYEINFKIFRVTLTTYC
ncbi:uncharacterized protein LOC134812729 isoform X2 [Bolinopsis microptera]|uniref:uncharacterized protein LOC134812729 isoform X2 n=1 Tax=Bolinopsis microptera TaxID=2820187 RepID=UPI0030793570